MPSRQHEQAKTSLFDHLQRKLITCSWCAMGLRESHPRFHDSSAAREPEQLVAWTCRSMHGHVLDILAGASSVALERRHSMPDGSFCVPDITVLNTDGQPLAFIEVVHTHEPERAVAIAGALDIPLFIVPAPGVPMVRPPLGNRRRSACRPTRTARSLPRFRRSTKRRGATSTGASRTRPSRMSMAARYRGASVAPHRASAMAIRWSVRRSWRSAARGHASAPRRSSRPGIPGPNRPAPHKWYSATFVDPSLVVDSLIELRVPGPRPARGTPRAAAARRVHP